MALAQRYHPLLKNKEHLFYCYFHTSFSIMKAIQSFIIILIYPFLFSCNNNAGDEAMKNFDSINQSLQKTNNSVNQTSTELYQMLEKKWAGTDKAGSLQQFKYQVQDFYGYMGELKRRFYLALGDSSGTGAGISMGGEEKVDITNRFFESDEAAIVLEAQLKNVQQAFLKINHDKAMAQKIDKLTDHPGKEFNTGWFYNIPPLAAHTLLYKFEYDVKYLEENLLSNLLAK
ncbi:MAG: hypothetical protein NTW29_18425 [Bacteroidetes bacterium]|nr:hypothetical protein [Bacteroidota bacterium]